MSLQGAFPRLVRSCVLCAAAALALAAPAADREWLAGDSHIHSHWSTGYDDRSVPPTPIKGRDALYSTPRNATMARRFGLRWMVTTDHGGPYHSKVNLEQAYRELTLSRELVPEMLQFYGMELNMPGMDHHTLIIPRAEDEASVLYEIESRFDANEDWARPPDPRRQSAGLRRQALAHLQGLDRLPILFANHPSRSAEAIGLYGRDEPWEFRENNDLAPDVYRGMEGAPGHQAATLTEDNSSRYRGSYSEPRCADPGGLRPDDRHRRRPVGRPPRRGPPILDRSFVRLAFPLRRAGESRERLLARRVPQDLGPRAPDLRRRPRRSAARPHVRGRRGPRDRARGQPDEREAPSRARRHAAGLAGGAGHRDRPVPRPGDREPGGREPRRPAGRRHRGRGAGTDPRSRRTTATPRRGSSPGSRATRWPATETATPSRRCCPRSTATSTSGCAARAPKTSSPRWTAPRRTPGTTSGSTRTRSSSRSSDDALLIVESRQDDARGS